MLSRQTCLGFALLYACFYSVSDGDIFRQISNQQIPGTDGVNPRKNANMSGLDLESAVLWSKNLSNANLSDTNLTGASLWGPT